MTPERWKRLRAAIEAALEAASPGEREAALARACADDPMLLSEARSIMEGAGEGDELLGSPPEFTREDEAASRPTLLGPRLARQLAVELRASFISQALGNQPEPAHDERSAAPSHPRFEILRRLGEGGMGIVYLAFDREHQAQVALKTIAKMSATLLARFKNEFRALSDVVHPNLVRLFELLGEHDIWFFTMEYVDGLSFLEYLRPRAKLDLGRLRAALPQLVEAVATIHAAGKLHVT